MDQAPQRRQLACPYCTLDMEEGFILDHTYGGLVQARWCPGLPKGSKWFGVRWRHRSASMPVSTFRCPQCGYLESYAAPERPR